MRLVVVGVKVINGGENKNNEEGGGEEEEEEEEEDRVRLDDDNASWSD